MALLPILLYGDARLEEKSEPVTDITAEIRELAANMALTMYAAPGVGLAAPQVGVNRRMVVVDCSGGDEAGGLITLINPEITLREGFVREEEGCLSFPDIVEVVERPEIVSVRALDLDGKELVIDRAEGLLARCLFHEVDHLDGVLLVDRVNAFRRSLLKKKIRKRMRNGEWTLESDEAKVAAL